ncbi:MAG TPA: hypothetical protein VFX60_09545 [Micromonospora sp.]|nr:hypothetical protein [Micromonospora sp.]
MLLPHGLAPFLGSFGAPAAGLAAVLGFPAARPDKPRRPDGG